MSATYDPETYDLLIPESFGGDVDWYRRLARESGGPVLELGAGTGRVTIPIAQDGLEIWALDAHRGMLDTLRSKAGRLPDDVRSRIQTVEGDMRTFALDHKFPLVIIPFRAFLHNLTSDDQLACLRRVHAHLTPGGRLALNVFHPSLEFMARNAGAFEGVWRWIRTHTRDDGSYIVRSEATMYDTVQRRVHSQHRYELYGADGLLTRTFLQRLELAYFYPDDIRHLLERAGFDAITIAGSFAGRPLQHDMDELVITATS
jgi:SAM-dependent methyltransferase